MGYFNETIIKMLKEAAVSKGLPEDTISPMDFFAWVGAMRFAELNQLKGQLQIVESNFVENYVVGIDATGKSITQQMVHSQKYKGDIVRRLIEQFMLEVAKPREPDKAAIANVVKPEVQGGIDLNTSAMGWKIRKDGNGVEMDIDPAMIARVRREGIDSLSPVIFRITPVTSIWSLVGLQAPAQA
jgi:hypothetical protein